MLHHQPQLDWIHGNSGKMQVTLEPGERTSHTTLLSHEWYVRDARTDTRPDSPGRFKLSENASIAKWKITSDTRKTYTIPLRTCHDLSGHCPWWQMRGECTRNPNFMNTECRLTCNQCESDAREDDDDFKVGSNDPGEVDAGTGKDSNQHGSDEL